ncbi:MAG: hypothetical protein ACOYME_03775 [Prochlorotrichaceae cyanobacterium]|jgi:hypothetical protein
MQRLTSLLSSSLALSTVLLSSLYLSPRSVQAQPAYGSYIGVAAGLGQRNEGNDDLDFSAIASGRYKLLELPISLRSQIFVDSNSLALVPTVSYDLPLTWQLEPYVGAGVAFSTEGSLVGDKTSFVVQPGVDYVIPNSRVVLFGNAVIAIDAFDGGERDGKTAVSVQTGIGYRF